MANLFQKIIANLDFWDKAENQRQNADFAAQDEEAKRRKQAQLAARQSVTRLGVPQTSAPLTVTNTPVNGPTFDTSKPLVKITAGSQSDINTPPVKVQVSPQQEMDELINAHREKAIAAEKQRTNPIARVTTDTGWKDRAEIAARTAAVHEYQQRHGFNKQPEVMATLNGTLQKSDALTKRDPGMVANIAKSAYDTVTHTGNRIAAGLPVIGTLAQYDQMYKSGKIDSETYNKLVHDEFDKSGYKMTDSTGTMARKFVGDAALTASNIFTGGVAGSTLETAGHVAAPSAIKVLLKGAGEEALLGGGAGGAQALAEDKPTVKSTATDIGAGGLFGALGTVGLAGGATVLKKAASKVFSKLVKVSEDAPAIPGLSHAGAEATPSVEVGNGIHSTNLPKAIDEAAQAAITHPSLPTRPDILSLPATAGHNIPDVTNPMSLAKVDPSAPVVKAPVNDVPMADFSNAINAPLTKATPALPEAPPRVETPPAADVSGNPAMVSDAQLASQLAERGVVPTPGPSPVATTEDAMAQAADEAARQQVIGSDGPSGFIFNDRPENIAIGKQLVKIDRQLQKVRQGTSTLSPDEVRGLVKARQDLANQAMGAAPSAPAEAIQPVAPVTPVDVNLDHTSAPQTRQQILNGIDNHEVVADLAANAPSRNPVNLQDAENSALSQIREMDDHTLVTNYQDGATIQDPEGFFKALHALKRLDTIDEFGLDSAELTRIQSARQGAFDAMAGYAEQSGRGLRTVQVLWDNMPPTMKVETLLKKLDRAGVEQSDQYRQQLIDLIGVADGYGTDLRATEEQLQNLAEGISSGAVKGKSPEVTAQVAHLTRKYDDLLRKKEYAAGDALDFYQSILPASPKGESVAHGAKIMMLSSPMGRVHDLISTTQVGALDALHSTVSAGLGKVVNAVKGAGTVIDTAPSPVKTLEGMSTGIADTGRSLMGDRRVSDFQGALNRPVSRSGITESSHVGWNTPLKKVGNVVKNAVLAATELPTHLSQGTATNKLYQLATQQGEKLGLKGQELRNYAEATQRLQSTADNFIAQQTHLKINNLHRNGVTQALTGIVKNIESSAKGTPWEHVIPNVVNQIAPFTSWVGGNLHRTLTDANVLSNVNQLRVGLQKGDHQLVTDSVAHLIVNGGLMTTGLLLAQEGTITDHDANGNNYAGGYFHIGNEYIPVAILGPYAAPVLLGASTNKAASKEGGLTPDDAIHIPLDAAASITKSLGVTSTLGGSNALQSGIANVGSGKTSAEDALPKIIAGAVGQYIPGLTNDINAYLDNHTGLNPTHEAADTKVTDLNPETGRQKTSQVESAIAGLQNRIPGLSQELPRKDGEAARTLTDRALQGTHETQANADSTKAKDQLRKEKVPLTDDDISTAIKDGNYEGARKGLEYQLNAYQKSPNVSKTKVAELKDKITQVDLQADGVPITSEGIKARTEEGDYERAIRGLKYQSSKLAEDKNTPPSKLKETHDDITRLQVTKDGKYPPSVIEMYQKTALSEWRALGNPESEDYDPDLYQLLWSYDEALAKNGVSRSAKDGDHQKYSAAKGRGSGSGGRGGSGSKPRGFTTNIATQSFSQGPAPIKAQAADFGTPQSSIPVLQKVPNNDRSKLKKITVTRGGR